jgi:hypothetical protein
LLLIECHLSHPQLSMLRCGIVSFTRSIYERLDAKAS